MASSMASMVAAIHTTPTEATAYASSAGGQQLAVQPQQATQSNASLIETGESTQEEIKTEFYTREGLWRLVTPSGEYARQLVVSQQQQFVQPSQQLPSTQSTATLTPNSYQAANTTAVAHQNGGSNTNLNG